MHCTGNIALTLEEAKQVVFMNMEANLKKYLKKPRNSPDFWPEDIQSSFLDSLLETMNTKNMPRKDLAETLGKSRLCQQDT